jgi:hypothetical protein
MTLFLEQKVDLDGPRNATVIVTGAAKQAEQRIKLVDLRKLAGSPKRVKISSIVWLIEEKMKLRLLWGPDEFLLPMESRNSVRFDHGLMSPEENKWNGVIEFDIVDVHKGNDYTDKYFFIQIELDKL